MVFLRKLQFFLSKCPKFLC